jgi:hypothetical protein
MAMAFVQVSKAKGLTKESFDRLRRAWIGEGLLDGMLFVVGGPGEGGWYLVEGWKSRRHCDAAMEQLMKALAGLELELPELTEEEFDLDYLRLG